MSSLMPTNTRRKPSCVETLAKSVISEAEAAQSEVTAMPAGGHAILDQARHAVERRARTLLSQLQEFGGRSLYRTPVAFCALVAGYGGG